MDLGAELGAKIFVLWGGREGTETDACRRPDQAVKRLREALNYLCEYNLDKKYGFKFALEAKPNEPRGDIYMATTGAYLGFIPTLAHPEMVGVNPEVAHEHMAGLNAFILWRRRGSAESSSTSTSTTRILAATIRTSVSARPLPKRCSGW